MQAKHMTFTHHYTANAGMELEQYSGKTNAEGGMEQACANHEELCQPDVELRADFLLSAMTWTAQDEVPRSMDRSCPKQTGRLDDCGLPHQGGNA